MLDLCSIWRSQNWNNSRLDSRQPSKLFVLDSFDSGFSSEFQLHFFLRSDLFIRSFFTLISLEPLYRIAHEKNQFFFNERIRWVENVEDQNFFWENASQHKKKIDSGGVFRDMSKTFHNIPDFFARVAKPRVGKNNAKTSFLYDLRRLAFVCLPILIASAVSVEDTVELTNEFGHGSNNSALISWSRLRDLFTNFDRWLINFVPRLEFSKIPRWSENAKKAKTRWSLLLGKSHFRLRLFSTSFEWDVLESVTTSREEKQFSGGKLQSHVTSSHFWAWLASLMRCCVRAAVDQRLSCSDKKWPAPKRGP